MKYEDKFLTALKQKLNNYQTRSIIYSGFLGKSDGTIEVAGLPGYVYIRMANGEVLTAFNQRVPNVFNLPVYFGYDPSAPKLFQVLSIRPVFVNQPSQTTLEIPDHDHTWPSRLTTWVRAEQFLPGLVRVKEGMVVSVYPFNLRKTNGTYVYIPYTELDLTSYIPAQGARVVLVEASENGSVIMTPSDTVSSIDSVTVSIIPASYHYPLAAVRLAAGISFLREEENYNDILDLRFWQSVDGTQWGNIAGNIEQQADLLSFLEEHSHLHVNWRWTADGAATIFDLPDYIDDCFSIFDNGLRVDPFAVTLAPERSQIIFDDPPGAGHVITIDYILERRSER